MGYISCDNKDVLSAEQLLQSCFGKDGNGNVYLRLVMSDITNCNDNLNAITCSNAGGMTLDNLVRSAVVLDSCGHAAIRVGIVEPD